MHLLNATVAVASALVGTVGAAVAYGTLNTTPIDHPEPTVVPVTLTHYLPCEPPSVLTDGVCVTTVVRTVVKTAEPIVITRVVESRPSKGRASAPDKPRARDDDHEDEDEDHEDEDHEDEDHEDEDHEDDEDGEDHPRAEG